MSRQVLAPSVFALALCTASAVHAASDADLAEIRDRDPAIEGILRSAHPGARAAAEGSRSERPRQRQAGTAAAAPAAAAAAHRSGTAGAAPTAGLSAFNPGDLGGPAGRVRQPVAGPGAVRDRRVRAERRHRAGQARLQHRRIRAGAVRERRRQGLREPHLLAVAGKHRRGRGSLRHVHRAAGRLHAQIRPLPLRASAT